MTGWMYATTPQGWCETVSGARGHSTSQDNKYKSLYKIAIPENKKQHEKVTSSAQVDVLNI